jgi:uncharacterized protein YycO
MKTSSKPKWVAIIVVVLVGVIALASNARASNAEVEDASSQDHLAILGMSDREVINNVETLLVTEDVVSWVVDRRSGLTDDEAKAIADMIRNGYALENELPYDSDLYYGSKDYETDEIISDGIALMASSDAPGIWHPGGGYSVGVGVYPSTKGKILVTTDWASGLLPTGHAAIVLDDNYAWTSFPKAASPAVGGVAVEGVQRERNNWNDPTRHFTCFALDVIRTNASQESAVVDWCANQTGKPYNFNFLNVDTRSSFYCSQLVWAAFKDLYGINMDPMNIPVAPGKTYTPIHPLNLVDSDETALLYRQGTARTGWQNVNGSDYYIDSYGNPLTGWQTIDGRTYHFDNSGVFTYGDRAYTIETTLSPSKFFDIANASTANGAAVQTGVLSRKPSQRFRLTYNSDGFYTIVNVNSNRALDIPGSNAVNGINVIQFQPTNNDNQRWAVVRAGTGADEVYLVPKLNPSLRLGIQNSSSAAGMKIQLQTATRSAAQRFKLEGIEPVAGLGEYYTVEASYTNKVLDVEGGGIANGTNVSLYQSNGTAHQMFHFGYDSNTGYYTILDFRSGKALDVTGSGTADGTNVAIFQRTDNNNQKWAIEKVGDYYLIYSACSGLALDIHGKNSVNGTNIQTWTPHGLDSQRFKLTSITHSVNTSRLPNGIYTIKASYTNKVLDVAGTGNGANVALYTPHGGANQKFLLTFDAATGCYVITNPQTGLVLEAAGSDTANGTNVQMWSSHGGDNQKWVIVGVDSINFRLHPRYSILYGSTSRILDAAGGGTANGTNVALWANNYTDHQMWTLARIG